MRAGCTDVNRVATRSPQFVCTILKLGRSSKPKTRIGTRYNLAISTAHSVGVCFPYPASASGENLTALLVLYLTAAWGRSTLALLHRSATVWKQKLPIPMPSTAKYKPRVADTSGILRMTGAQC